MEITTAKSSTVKEESGKTVFFAGNNVTKLMPYREKGNALVISSFCFLREKPERGVGKPPVHYYERSKDF